MWLLVGLALWWCLTPVRVWGVSTSASAAVLMDADTGQVLYDHNGSRRMLIASTTKIMTALVVLERASPGDVITVKQKHMTEGSSMYLRPGERVTVEELLYGLLLCSGNDAAEALADGCGVPLATFGPEPAPDVLAPLGYAASPDGIRFDAPPCGEGFHTTQSGRHSALNACAVLALLRLLKLPQAQTPERLREAIAAFRGVRQRFEQMGSRADGTPVINDYAHNPEKIAAALATARERFGSPLTAVFQPHGFSALRNFRAQLRESLSASLTTADTLILLPVYYAGGTATFSPTSDEVAAELRDGGLNAVALSREAATRAIAAQAHPSCVIVMGARDPSLRDWSAQLAST